jgi:hypothetical protein
MFPARLTTADPNPVTVLKPRAMVESFTVEFSLAFPTSSIVSAVVCEDALKLEASVDVWAKTVPSCETLLDV